MAQKEGGTYSKRTWGGGGRNVGYVPTPPPKKKSSFRIRASLFLCPTFCTNHNIKLSTTMKH